MDAIKVRKVVMTGEYECQSESNQDAINKTIAYFAAHLDELSFQITERTIWLNDEEE